jgi:hypothetical protein
MALKELVEIRKQAEQAVAEMPEGELKVKAFEVIFNHLLGTERETGRKAPSVEEGPPQPPLKATTSSRSASGRILVLRDEGFFATPKTIRPSGACNVASTAVNCSI